MASRLDYIKVAPRTILDAGCGTGEAVGELGVRYRRRARGRARCRAADGRGGARTRARRARSLFRRLLPDALRGGGHAAPVFVCGDINMLPLPGVAFDLVWSNLALQWVNDLPRAFAEVRRVLKVGGLYTFTTFGPDTLKEIRSAFARADGHTHTNRFTDMHDIGDMLVAAGFADPVMDMEQLTLTYADADALMRELKHVGATNATRGRPHGLMGRAPLAAGAGRARGHAPRRTDSGDLRGRLWPRVEGRAAAHARRAPDREAHAPGDAAVRWLAEFSSRAPIPAWERPWSPSRCCARSPLRANARPA